MSQNDHGNDHSGVGVAAALVGAGLLFFFLLIYALFLFGAFVMSILCLCAWNSPVMLGSWTLEPDEARGFIKRGLVGAFVLPAFALFCEFVFGFRINDAYLPHLVLGGYALGSLGIAMLVASNEAEADSAASSLPAPPPPAQIAPPKDVTSQTPKPFRFASWDDEEPRR